MHVADGDPVSERAMPTIGRFVTDPQGGGYCQIDLDSGQQIMVTIRKTSPEIAG
jgi:hypothetical protein